MQSARWAMNTSNSASCFCVRSPAGLLDLRDVLALSRIIAYELVNFGEVFLIADYLRLERGDLEDCMALVTSAPLCARYASVWYVSVCRAIVYKVRIGLRRRIAQSAPLLLAD
jgi:hypothetical protein